jgi:putative sterol carrier protein
MVIDNERSGKVMVNERIALLAKEPPNKYLSPGWNGTYLINMGEAGRCRFQVRDGQIAVLDEDGEADCQLECSYEDAMGILDGSINMVTALFRNRLRVQGDPGLAQRLHAFVRATNDTAQRRVRR